jgi:hypothetical protein
MGPPHFLQLIANDLPGLAVDVAFSGAGPFRDLGLRPWDDVAECQQAGRVSARRVGSHQRAGARLRPALPLDGKRLRYPSAPPGSHGTAPYPEIACFSR